MKTFSDVQSQWGVPTILHNQFLWLSSVIVWWIIIPILIDPYQNSHAIHSYPLSHLWYSASSSSSICSDGAIKVCWSYPFKTFIVSIPPRYYLIVAFRSSKTSKMNARGPQNEGEMTGWMRESSRSRQRRREILINDVNNIEMLGIGGG
jgi:hypothetical protein